jgi:hypothetical protein
MKLAAVAALALAACHTQAAPPVAPAAAAPTDPVREALAPLPAPLRATATVVRITATGHEIVRQGTGTVVCFRMPPKQAEAEFDARCYHQDFMPFIYRGLELIAQGLDPKAMSKQIDADVQAGTLVVPKSPTVGYRVLGPARAFDAATGEITAEMQSWQSVHVPYATAEQLGVADMSTLSDAAQKWEPYSMAVGTYWAHIMIEHPPRPH